MFIQKKNETTKCTSAIKQKAEDSLYMNGYIHVCKKGAKQFIHLRDQLYKSEATCTLRPTTYLYHWL